MIDLWDDLSRWRAEGRRVALARVVDVEGSGPRGPGAAMAVSEDGEVIGSVSGGCVESAVVTEALGVLDGGVGRVVSFGYSDDDAFAVGLTCGGTVHLFIDVLDWDDDLWTALGDGFRHRRPVALATAIGGRGIGSVLVVGLDHRIGTLGDDDLDRVVARDARGQLEAGSDEVRHYGPCGEARERDVTVFVESFAPPPRMVVFGAVDFTGALVRAAKLVGFHVTVCDARPVFATTRRFPEADEVVVDWPDRHLEGLEAADDVPPLGERDAICILTHDAKFDVPAVRAALATGAGYIGAMGSRRTHRARVERLAAEGVVDLDRLRSPIGLDLGARTPEEVAVAILAEVIAVRTGHQGRALRDTDGPLH